MVVVAPKEIVGTEELVDDAAEVVAPKANDGVDDDGAVAENENGTDGLSVDDGAAAGAVAPDNNHEELAG